MTGLLHEDIFHVGVACDISPVQASKGDNFTEASNMENALMQQPSHIWNIIFFDLLDLMLDLARFRDFFLNQTK